MMHSWNEDLIATMRGDPHAYCRMKKAATSYVRRYANLDPTKIQDIVSGAFADLLDASVFVDSVEECFKRALQRRRAHMLEELTKEQSVDPITGAGAAALEKGQLEQDNEHQRLRQRRATAIAIKHYMLRALKEIENDRYHDLIVSFYRLPVPLRDPGAPAPNFKDPKVDKARRRAREEWYLNLEQELVMATKARRRNDRLWHHMMEALLFVRRLLAKYRKKKPDPPDDQFGHKPKKRA